MLAVSCRDYDEELVISDSSKAQVVFSVAMDSPVTRSRAADGEDNANTENNIKWGDTDNYDHAIGDAYDNRIDMNQLIVKIEGLNKGEKQTYNITDIIKWNSGAGNEYKFVGIVEGVNQSTTLINPKVYVYANMGTTTPAESFNMEDVNFIPMWGVKSVSGDLTFTPGTRVDLNQISLLRAMAKIEVSLSKPMGDEPGMSTEYDLIGATLNKYKTTGYTYPTVPTSFSGSTEDLDLEDVLNVYGEEDEEIAENLHFVPTKDGSSYVVYLPEVENNGTTDEDLLKITVKLREKNGKEEEEGSFFIKDYSKQNENKDPEAINIIRNHWYKYTITGFAASKILVSYNAVDWNNVNITIGGEGFLHLDKDLIEIYNSNISEDDLKFYSSSPITSIVLTDLYTHKNNGTFVEGTTDGVSAYYISKYGQKIQLGTDPDFDVTDKEAALARELVILDNISATAEENTFNGYITINSPFLADPTNEIPELQQSSHYDTPRYLEFLVTNEQDLTATFRVIQYPPVVITNEEGFYSFRDDHVLTDDPLEKPFDLFTYDPNFHSVMTSSMYLVHIHDFTEEPRPTQEQLEREGDVMRLVKPEDFTGEPNDEYWNTPQQNRNYSWTKKTAGEYTWLPLHTDNSCPTQGSAGEQWIEVRYGFYDNAVTFTNVDNKKSGTKTFSGIHRPAEGERPYTDYLYRNMYQHLHGEYDITSDKYKGTGLGQYYKAEVLDKDGNKVTRVFRDHYRWNAQPLFWSKFVHKYYDKAGQGASYSGKSVYKYKGQVDMYEYGPSEDGGKTWGRYIYSTNLYKFANNRMYKIKTTTTSDSYTIGFPSLSDNGETMNTESNARMVSPYIMLASQLGETNHQQFLDNATAKNYIIPNIKEMYKNAVRHCREYVETTFKDVNGDHMWNEGEEIIEYRNWRLPTKAEIEMIIDYQSNSRAIDRVLDAQYYYCVTGTADSDKIENVHNWVSSEVPGYDSETSKGYYIRCVRDVKSEQDDNK